MNNIADCAYPLDLTHDVISEAKCPVLTVMG